METKKTRKILLLFVIIALVVFALILFFNNRLEKKNQNLEPEEDNNIEAKNNYQSYTVNNLPTINDDDCVSGNGKDLDIIVYEDYSDIFSADFYNSLEQARSDFKDRLRIAYRPFNFSNTDLSWQAALAVKCAFQQNRGDDFRGKIFQIVSANQFNSDKLKEIAQELNLNQDDFEKCLADPENKEKIIKLSLEAANFSVYGVPTIFVGDEMIVGARPYTNFIDSNGDEIEGLKQVIERQLK